MTERPQSDAELDALLAELEETPADFGNDLRKRAAAALRQVRHERDELLQPIPERMIRTQSGWDMLHEANQRLAAANTALREALSQSQKLLWQARSFVIQYGAAFEVVRIEATLEAGERALASSAPKETI